MSSNSESPCSWAVALALLLWCSCATPAQGDGGGLRAWKQSGAYDIAVFTEPTPCITGLLDISVLLLDRSTGASITEAAVTVEVSPLAHPEQSMRHPATEQAATNKLLRAAIFEIQESGQYHVMVKIDGPNNHTEVEFELDVGAARSLRTGIWPWVLWPVPVIILYVIHRRLVERRRLAL